ncbi:hypothetical protein ACOME3_003453 [Neoechinorhynchus agilis]
MVDSKQSDWVSFFATGQTTSNDDFDIEFDPLFSPNQSIQSVQSQTVPIIKHDPFTHTQTEDSSELCIAELLLDKLEADRSEASVSPPYPQKIVSQPDSIIDDSFSSLLQSKKSGNPNSSFATPESFYSVFSQISQLTDQYKTSDDENEPSNLLQVNRSQIGRSAQSIDLLHSESSYEIAKERVDSTKMYHLTNLILIEENEGRRPSTVLDQDLDPITLQPLKAASPTEEHDHDSENSWFVMVRTPLPKSNEQPRSWLKAFVKYIPHPQHCLQIFCASSSPTPEAGDTMVVEVPLLARYKCSYVRLQQSMRNRPLHSFKVFDPESATGRTSAGTSLLTTGKRIFRRISLLSDVIPSLSDMGLSKSKSSPYIRCKEIIKFGYEDIRGAEKMRDDLDVIMWNCPAPSPVSPTNPIVNQQLEDVVVKVREEIECHVKECGDRYLSCRNRVYVSYNATAGNSIEIGLNFRERCGREVVRREEILPLKNELWMRSVAWTQLPDNGIVDHCVFRESRLLKYQPVSGHELWMLFLIVYFLFSISPLELRTTVSRKALKIVILKRIEHSMLL